MPPGFNNPLLTLTLEDRLRMRNGMSDLLRTPDFNPAASAPANPALTRSTPSAMPADRGSALPLPLNEPEVLPTVGPTPKPIPRPMTPGIPGGEMMRPGSGPTPVSLPTAERTPLRPLIPSAAPAVPAPEGLEGMREQLGQASAASMNRAGVDLPALSKNGRPTAYSPMEAARYDAGMKRAKRDEAGNLTGKFKRSKGDIFMNALHGFAQGAQSGGIFGGLGGAAAGAIGSAVNPAAGAQYRFDNEEAPRFQAEQRAAAEARRQMQDEEKARLANAKTQEEINKIQQEFSLRKAELEMKQREDERKRKADESKLTAYNPEFDLRDPSGKLIQKGQPRLTPQRPEYPFSSAGNRVYNRETGQFTDESQELQPAGDSGRQVRVPDSSRELLGKIAEAQAAGNKEEANALIDKLGRQYGDVFETGKGEGGWAYFKPRETQRPSRSARTGGGKSASAAPVQKIFPASRLEEFARAKGISLDQARDHIQRVKGYKIQ